MAAMAASIRALVSTSTAANHRDRSIATTVAPQNLRDPIERRRAPRDGIQRLDQSEVPALLPKRRDQRRGVKIASPAVMPIGTPRHEVGVRRAGHRWLVPTPVGPFNVCEAIGIAWIELQASPS
jgi:hypothetical protein